MPSGGGHRREPKAWNQDFFSSVDFLLLVVFLLDFLVDFLSLLAAALSSFFSMLASFLAMPEAACEGIGAPACEAAKAVDTANREAIRAASSLFMGTFQVIPVLE